MAAATLSPTVRQRAAQAFSPRDQTDGWVPHPKQAAANTLAVKADELLYGGAAGGGKSHWLVHHVVGEMIRYPGNRGAIFRRVRPSLHRTIVPRVREAIGGIGRLNETTLTVTFKNGSVLEMAGLQYEQSVKDYQGAEYGIVAFEEVTEFLQSQWEFLIGRLRAPVDGVHPHAIATTNPGGVGHRWVKRRFVKPDPVDVEDDHDLPEPLEVWRPRATEDNSTPEQPPLSRCFVPANLDDNPTLQRRDPGYRARLRANTNRSLRKALETGDWDAIDAIDGALWQQWWLDHWRIDSPPQSARRIVAVDPSDAKQSSDAYGVCVASVGVDGRGYVEQSYEWRDKPIAQLIDDTVGLFHGTRADAVVVERNHGGAWLEEAFRGRHPNVRLTSVWASDGKRTRAEPISVLFEPVNESEPRACLVGYHPILEEQMTTTVFDPKQDSPDVLDSCVWALSELMVGSEIFDPVSMLAVTGKSGWS